VDVANTLKKLLQASPQINGAHVTRRLSSLLVNLTIQSSLDSLVAKPTFTSPLKWQDGLIT
jgi:hypothetical protein